MGKRAAPPKAVCVSDSDTDSLPTGVDTPNTIRMTGDSPQSPSNPQDQEDALEEKIARKNQEISENALRRAVLPTKCEEQQRTKQWIEDVRKAMNNGDPIPDKPEEIEILYPSLEIRKKTPEEAPQEEASPDQTPPPRIYGQDTLQEEVPANNLP